jgi:orotate phosphoribosyltransferase
MLLHSLIRTHSFKYSPTPVFRLASGATSHVYIDCRVGLSYPDVRHMIGELMLNHIEQPVDAVGGLLIGAYPIAIAISDAAFWRNEQVIRAFAIRKEPKAHGLKKLIEGDVKEGDRVVIVDDVITSGSSTIEAIHKSREAGLVVAQVIVIIDREEQEGKASIEDLGVKVAALCTLRDLQELAGVPLEQSD